MAIATILCVLPNIKCTITLAPGIVPLFNFFFFCRLHSSQVQGPGGAINSSSSQAQQATRLNTTADTTVSMQEDSDELQEVIEVQILPQVG